MMMRVFAFGQCWARQHLASKQRQLAPSVVILADSSATFTPPRIAGRRRAASKTNSNVHKVSLLSFAKDALRIFKTPSAIRMRMTMGIRWVWRLSRRVKDNKAATSMLPSASPTREIATSG